jgi:hypothetical protein
MTRSLTMLGRLCLAAALPLVLIATPVSAATKEEKMETCKVGAESQNLTGAKQQAFIKRCMAGGNYEPQARKDAMKKTGAKPAAAPAAAPKPQ